MAPGHIHPVIGLTALLCIAVGAGAAGALNMWYDADIDARMARTAARPIPAGRLMPGEALAFGLTLAVGSVVVLGLLVNVVAAALLAFTIFFYVVVYTMWLKRTTPQNIVIGGAAGALPPMIGWAAATGGVAVEPIRSVPHHLLLDAAAFLGAVALPREDYARAGIPMLPVVAGDQETRRQILLYTLILAPLGAAPWLLGYAGPIYGVVALARGAAMIALALRVRAERRGHVASKQLFGFSILYLFLLFAMLLVDRMLGGLYRPFRGMTAMSETMNEDQSTPPGPSMSRRPASGSPSSSSARAAPVRSRLRWRLACSWCCSTS